MVLDVIVTRGGLGGARDANRWCTILSTPHKNITFVVHNLHMVGLREPIRQRLLLASLASNPRLQGIEMVGQRFTDWLEVKRSLSSLHYPLGNPQT